MGNSSFARRSAKAHIQKLAYLEQRSSKSQDKMTVTQSMNYINILSHSRFLYYVSKICLLRRSGLRYMRESTVLPSMRKAIDTLICRKTRYKIVLNLRLELLSKRIFKWQGWGRGFWKPGNPLNPPLNNAHLFIEKLKKFVVYAFLKVALTTIQRKSSSANKCIWECKTKLKMCLYS